MPDMLVNLYEIPQIDDSRINSKNYTVKRLLTPDIYLLEEFIAKNFSNGWISEVKAACYKSCPSVFVAVYEHQIVGFAAYDATAKGYFGPLGVCEEHRKHGLASSLVLHCMHGLKNDGYGYAIIGGVGEAKPLYEKCCYATDIKHVSNVYSRMVRK